MKTIILLTFFVFTACIAGFSQKMVKAPEVLELKEQGFDFGKIPQGRPVTHNFEITNKGKTPLALEDVQASCGCTTPEWEMAAIRPGATSMIKVGFNASSEGHFSKNVTLSYGGGQTRVIVISGEVYSTPTTSAPLNTSLSSLKQIN
ncbi:MAG: DUF1573 domain-containing protein [Flavitalea sp.]